MFMFCVLVSLLSLIVCPLSSSLHAIETLEHRSLPALNRHFHRAVIYVLNECLCACECPRTTGTKKQIERGGQRQSNVLTNI